MSTNQPIGTESAEAQNQRASAASRSELGGRRLVTQQLEQRITPLLVVIAIIAILIGLLVPAVSKA